VSADPRCAFFNDHAATWDTDGPPAALTLARLEELKPVLGLRPGLDVLEVGCGTGQVTPWLAREVAPGRVTAVDFAPAMLARAAARGTDAQFRCVDVCAADLGLEVFDLIWCLHVFPHLRDQSEGLRRMARALRPGGALLVLHLDSWQNINAFHTRVGGVVGQDHLPPPGAWEALLTDAGLHLADLIARDDLFCVRAVRG